MSSYTQTSQNFVRALKASTDPPHPSGLQKIEIAQLAWDNTSFAVPNKGEVIIDWILTRLLKDKYDVESKSSAIADTRFWILMNNIITHQVSSNAARPTKVWLLPLLNRTPIAPIMLAYLGILEKLDNIQMQCLCPIAQKCFDIMWPLGVHRFPLDLLLDCFGSVLAVFEMCTADENLARSCLMIVASYQAALENSSIKRKLYVSFIGSYLDSWVRCISGIGRAAIEGTCQSLLENIYAAGFDTIFNIDTLRQTQGSHSEDKFFDFLVKSMPASSARILTITPRIFQSYVQCIHKYRGALFSLDSSQSFERVIGQVKAAGMRFFASCSDLLDCAAQDTQLWSTRASLLAIVDSEKLFSTTDQVGRHPVSHSRELAISALGESWQTERSSVASSVVSVLETLVRIDYDIIGPSLPKILPRLLLAQNISTNALPFLDLILEYHVKTRTLNSYALSMLSALSDHHILSSIKDPRFFYELALSSPVFSADHLEHFSRSVHNFITPGQVVQTTREVLMVFTDAWNRCQENFVQKRLTAKKKRETGNSTPANSDAETLAVVFSLATRIISVILLAIAGQSLSEITRSDLDLLIKEAQKVAARASFDLLWSQQPENHSIVWAQQIATTAALRFDYGLKRSGCVNQSNQDGGNLLSVMFQVVQEENTLPELTLEIFRSLLGDMINENDSHSVSVLNSVLSYLEWHLVGEGRMALSKLGNDEKHTPALDILHLLIKRWMADIDLVPSTQYLARFLQLVFNVHHISHQLPTTSARRVRATNIVGELFCSAQFWELPNLRAVFLTLVDEKTSFLDRIDLTRVVASNSVDLVNTKLMQQVDSIYELLLFVPVEYYTRSYRVQFMQRAMKADVLDNIVPKQDGHLAQKAQHSVAIIRTFLKCLCHYHGALDHSTTLQYLGHLMGPATSSGLLPDVLLLVTLDLIEIQILSILRLHGDKSEMITSVVGWLLGHRPFEQSSQDVTCNRLVEQCVVRFTRSLTTQFKVSIFSKQTITSLKQLYDNLLATLTPQLVKVASQGFSSLSASTSTILAAWSNSLAFGNWLGLDHSLTPRLGQNIASNLIYTSRSRDTSVSISTMESTSAETVALLFEELRCLSHLNITSHLEVTLATYMVCRSQLPGKLDACIVNVCKWISVQEFSHLLDIIHAELAMLTLTSAERISLLHLSSVLLHEAPQGTSQISQSFLARCLSIFTNNIKEYINSVDLCCDVLTFIDQFCSEKPASIRSSELSNIWSFLSQVIAGSPSENASTSPLVFHRITAIVSNLIRSRRDLVVHTLPHLGMLLRALIKLTRRPRSRLGAKQARVVTDTFPAWIHSAHPLSPEECRALARLLTTLTAKSIPSTHQSSSNSAASTPEPQKAESLTKPFSRHAVYVLVAYVEVMNDPLCVLTIDMRKELEPGMFALCEMIGEHNRDAVMTSLLDAGGKTVMKELWKQFEKQRYVGKG